MANAPNRPAVDVKGLLTVGMPPTDVAGRPVPCDELFAPKWDRAATGGRHVGLYFSAHLCPPCRTFTPQLIHTYQRLKQEGKDFEIVFCSRDNDRREFDQYAAKMPWMRLPFRDGRVDRLMAEYHIQSIPTLVIVNEEGHVVSNNARMAIPHDADGNEYPWAAYNSKSSGRPTVLMMLAVALVLGYAGHRLFSVRPPPMKL